MVRTNIVVGRFFQIIGLLFIALGIAGLAGLELDEALAGTATSVATALITMLEDIIEEAVRGGGASQPQVPSSGVVTHPQREPTALPSYPPSGPEGEVAAGRPQTQPLPESGEPGYVASETPQAPEGMESEQGGAQAFTPLTTPVAEGLAGLRGGELAAALLASMAFYSLSGPEEPPNTLTSYLNYLDSVISGVGVDAPLIVTSRDSIGERLEWGRGVWLGYIETSMSQIVVLAYGSPGEGLRFIVHALPNSKGFKEAIARGLLLANSPVSSAYTLADIIETYKSSYGFLEEYRVTWLVEVEAGYQEAGLNVDTVYVILEIPVLIYRFQGSASEAWYLEFVEELYHATVTRQALSLALHIATPAGGETGEYKVYAGEVLRRALSIARDMAIPSTGYSCEALEQPIYIDELGLAILNYPRTPVLINLAGCISEPGLVESLRILVLSAINTPVAVAMSPDGVAIAAVYPSSTGLIGDFRLPDMRELHLDFDGEPEWGVILFGDARLFENSAEASIEKPLDFMRGASEWESLTSGITYSITGVLSQAIADAKSLPPAPGWYLLLDEDTLKGVSNESLQETLAAKLYIAAGASSSEATSFLIRHWFPFAGDLRAAIISSPGFIAVPHPEALRAGVPWGVVASFEYAALLVKEEVLDQLQKRQAMGSGLVPLLEGIAREIALSPAEPLLTDLEALLSTWLIYGGYIEGLGERVVLAYTPGASPPAEAFALGGEPSLEACLPPYGHYILNYSPGKRISVVIEQYLDGLMIYVSEEAAVESGFNYRYLAFYVPAPPETLAAIDIYLGGGSGSEFHKVKTLRIQICSETTARNKNIAGEITVQLAPVYGYIEKPWGDARVFKGYRGEASLAGEPLTVFATVDNDAVTVEIYIAGSRVLEEKHTRMPTKIEIQYKGNDYIVYLMLPEYKASATHAYTRLVSVAPGSAEEALGYLVWVSGYEKESPPSGRLITVEITIYGAPPTWYTVLLYRPSENTLFKEPIHAYTYIQYYSKALILAVTAFVDSELDAIWLDVPQLGLIIEIPIQ